jgi:hypothetical protein
MIFLVNQYFYQPRCVHNRFSFVLVLGELCNPKIHTKDEVTEELRKLHDDELNDLYPHPVLFG